LGELTVTWTGDDNGAADFRVDEYGDEDPVVVGELVTEDDGEEVLHEGLEPATDTAERPLGGEEQTP
jgi:hypothetical protein